MTHLDRIIKEIQATPDLLESDKKVLLANLLNAQKKKAISKAS